MRNPVNNPLKSGPVRHLRVRFAGRRDQSKVADFYQKNQVLWPGPKEIKAILNDSERQRVYIIEEASHNRIVAAGACVAHCDGRYVEIAGAIVLWKGYGLQSVLTYIRTLQSLVMTSGDVNIFCVVEPEKAELRQRMRDLGFDVWTDPPEELVGTLANRGHPGAHLLKFDTNVIEQHRLNLLALAKTKVLRHFATGDEAWLSLDILLNNDPHFRRALEHGPPLPI